MATVAELLARSSQSQRLSVERLLGHQLGKSRAWLFAHGDFPLPPEVVADLEQNLSRLDLGEPLAYLLGSWEFFSLELKVSPGTLVPRPETELLVEKALELIPEDQPLEVLDLGTGSGAIALAIASLRPRAMVTATDLSPAALAVARDNARTHVPERVMFCQGNWWQAVPERQFDLVVSNPPYVVPGDPRLTARGEPETALFGGADGLDAYRKIQAGLARHLKVGGHLLLEHGLDQQQEVLDLLAGQFKHLEGSRDLAGHPRMVIGQGYGQGDGQGDGERYGQKYDQASDPASDQDGPA